MKTLSQILIQEREKRGISQNQLSVLAGIRQSHLDRIEREETKPTMPTVFRICKALGVDPLAVADELATEFDMYVADKFPGKSTAKASKNISL